MKWNFFLSLPAFLNYQAWWQALASLNFHQFMGEIIGISFVLYACSLTIASQANLLARRGQSRPDCLSESIIHSLWIFCFWCCCCCFCYFFIFILDCLNCNWNATSFDCDLFFCFCLFLHSNKYVSIRRLVWLPTVSLGNSIGFCGLKQVAWQHTTTEIVYLFHAFKTAFISVVLNSHLYRNSLAMIKIFYFGLFAHLPCLIGK